MQDAVLVKIVPWASNMYTLLEVKYFLMTKGGTVSQKKSQTLKVNAFRLGKWYLLEQSCGLTLDSCQVPTKLLYLSPASIKQEEEIRLNSSWDDIRIGKSFIIHCHQQN